MAQPLTDIRDRRVVVVAGPELSVIGEEPGNPTLYQLLPRELVRRFNLDERMLPDSYSILQASNLYLQNPSNEPDDIHREVREVLNGHQWGIPGPLRQLAEIRDLNLFVSTTFDWLLEDALNQVRFQEDKRTRALAYSEKAQVQDLPGDFESMPHPTVFYLFGRFHPSGDYAFTEEKILEYSHRLQSRDLRPPNLFDQLRTKHLPVLGCSLPGWLARFILRASRGDGLITQGARGSVVADQCSCADSEFTMFLERPKVALYCEDDAVGFVHQLYGRWRAQSDHNASVEAPTEPQTEPFKPDSVFLSYASEDRAAAIQVKKALDAAGVDVWFDKDHLESGDHFRRVIERNIDHRIFSFADRRCPPAGCPLARSPFTRQTPVRDSATDGLGQFWKADVVTSGECRRILYFSPRSSRTR